MAHVQVNNSDEIFGDATSIADLAQHSFADWDANHRNIYQADQRLHRDWRDELADIDMEYLTGVTARFKDGSVLRVSAWSGCCDHGNCKWCGGRYDA